MIIKYSVFFFLVSLFCRQQAEVKHFPIHIYPGKGIDSLELDKSTIKDVLKYHSLKYEITEKIEFEKPQGLWFHFYNAANHEQDLNFFLTSYGTRSYLKAKHQRLQLTSISIWNNDAAYFDGDLRIGKSSFADISSKFKLDTTTFRSSAGITGFDKEAGLNFSFNALRILQGVTMFSTGTNVKKPSVQVH